MTRDEFWDIVDRVHAAAPQDMDAKCAGLEAELRQLPLEEVLSFEVHFGECYYQANTWDVWGAAYLICGGCGDDSFMDFRSTLISCGRRPFEAAMTNADALADFDINPKWARYQGYQSVAREVYRNQFHHEPPERTGPAHHPHGTRGEWVDEAEMAPRFPRLVAKFNHRDADPEELRLSREKAALYEATVAMVRRVLLNGIVPACALVPLPRIVKTVTPLGRSPASSGLSYTWEPFALDEGTFWRALPCVLKPEPHDLNERPDLRGKRIALDTDTNGINDYEHWIRALQERGIG